MSRRKLVLPWIPGLHRPNFMFYRIKIAIPTSIPNSVIFALIFFSVFYIYVGGVYDLVEQPFARGTDQGGRPVLLYEGQDRQFLIEGLVAGILMFVGAIGLYILHQATSDPHNPGRAGTYQLVGIILLFLAFLILQNMYCAKIGGCGPE